jgi:hypothetical protein
VHRASASDAFGRRDGGATVASPGDTSALVGRESLLPELAIIVGSAHPALGAEIARLLGAAALPVALERFADGEL